MAVPVWESAATHVADASGANTVVNYPAVVNAGDVLVCIFAYGTNSGSITWPAGWFEFSPQTAQSGLSTWMAVYVADGTEDGGTFTITHGSTSTVRIAQVYRFSGVDNTMPIDTGAFGTAFGTDASAEHPAIVTGGADRLAVSILAAAGAVTLSDYTGESGGTWVERDEVSTTLGLDMTVGMATAAMAAQGTLSGGTSTLSAAEDWRINSFALNPATTHAIAFDAESEAEGTSLSWTHTPVGTPKGVLVGVVENARGTLGVTAVTYGGTAMTKVLDAFDTATELGAVSVWFLGTSVPTGAQTVAVTAGAEAKWGSCVTLTAAGNLEVVDSDRVQENALNPNVTLQTGTGVETFIAAWLFSGQDSLNSSAYGPHFNQMLANSRDFGTQTASGARGKATYLGGNIPFRITTTSTDDLAYVAVAVKASTAVPGVSAVGAIATVEAFGTTGIRRAEATAAIATGEQHGTPGVRRHEQPAGVASTEAVGAPAAQRTLGPTGVASAELTGTPRISTVTAQGVPSGEAHGASGLRRLEQPAGVGSAETAGAPGQQRILGAVAVASAEAAGTPAEQRHLGAVGVASGETLGAPATIRLVLEAGVASAEAHGRPSLASVLTLTGVGATAPAEAHGVAGVRRVETPSGIATAEAFGTPAFTRVTAQGIASAEQTGAPGLARVEAPAGAQTAEALGAPAGVRLVGPAGVQTAETAGVAAERRLVGPAAVASAEALGQPTLVQGSAGVTGVGATPSAEQHGTPGLLRLEQTVGIVSLAAVGQPGIHLVVDAAGLSSEEQHGAAQAARVLAAVGVITAEQAGQTSSRRIIGTVSVTSAEAFGQATVGAYIPPGPATAGQVTIADQTLAVTLICDRQLYVLAICDVPLAVVSVADSALDRAVVADRPLAAVGISDTPGG